MEPCNASPATQRTDSSASIIGALVVGTLFSFCVVGLRGVPAPRVQDEFAYLLAADTFAHGRITNQTHPLWKHFESFHIIHTPSYNAKYPPLQSLTLTAGQWLGHPIIGACVASGVSIAALVWMLYGWLPEKMHGVAWCVAVAHPSFHFFFAHSYMGGAVAITGSSLLLGAFARLDTRLRPHLGIVAGTGVVLLANSRPFEGLVLTCSVGLGLLFRVIHAGWPGYQFMARILAPASLVLLIGFGGMAAYNHHVTGAWSKMPYQVHESTYGWNPIFVWQQAGPKPEYRHPEMDRFFTEDKQATDQTYATLSSTLRSKLKASIGLLAFFCGPLILTGLIGVMGFYRDRLLPYLLAFLIPVFLASIASKWANFHYAAPAAPLLLALALAGTSAIYQWSQRYQFQMKFLAGIAAFHVIWFINVVSNTGKLHRGNWGYKREAVAQRLQAEAGPDLVLVRYKPGHIVHQEWVYNHADIDQSEVIWAREIDPQQRQTLLEYFKNRNVWVVEVGREDFLLKRFSPPTSRSNLHSAHVRDQPEIK